MIQIFYAPIVLIATALFFSATACQSPPKETQGNTQASTPVFFDLKGYMSQQSEALKISKPRVKKQISINGKKEEQLSDQINFEEELAVFANSDINKPAWSDKYTKDSSFSGGQLQNIRYLAKEENLKTQMMQVSFSSGNVSKIEVKNRTSAAIVTAEQTMTYTPGKGYSIIYKEMPALSEAKNFSVEAFFQ
ncbi:MAG: hypothetical protein SH848_05805 [Saprospiraceae bacterium]|nr:hypothetical protein [Saprospiraceae bacterium]MDZ4703422.1 hypothetical protein [Saprospiraceae bacterium]